MYMKDLLMNPFFYDCFLRDSSDMSYYFHFSVINSMILNFCKFQSLHASILHVNIGTPLLWTGIKLVHNCFWY